MDNLNIKQEAFEGPFDLLFHLINKNKIDIYDIEIATITDQYLEYIQNYDMDHTSRFIIMAATLIEIKSKLLLPKQKTEDEDIDFKQELVDKLMEYKIFKEVSLSFEKKYSNLPIITRKRDPIVKAFKKSTKNEIQPMDSLYLRDLLINCLERQDLKIDKVKANFNKIKKDLYTVNEKINILLVMTKQQSKINIQNLLEDCKSKEEKIVIVLAVLEILKMNEFTIKQVQNFENIILERA